ncbi:MAG: hypothetical protein NT069_33150, partial [Planctomycetota bacterium]|nr:hypothetical protein [Planctomycetota bacterium]
MNDEFPSVSAAASAALNVCNERLAAAKDHPTKGVQVHVEMSVATARLLATESLQSPTAAVVE